VGSGKWEVGSGKWEVGSGKWEAGSGKWEAGSGKRHLTWECPIKGVSMKMKMKTKMKIKNSLLTQKQGSILFLDYQLSMGLQTEGLLIFIVTVQCYLR